MPIPSVLFLMIGLQSMEPIPEVLAKSLREVPGPIIPSYPDPARGPGYSGLDARIRIASRRTGTVPTLGVKDFPITIKDHVTQPAGWRAFRLEVPPRQSVKARLKGLHEAWFQVKCVNKWGQIEEGMLKNIIPTGNPEAFYTNPKDETNVVYFIVDTTELGITGEEYTLTITKQDR